MATVTSASRVSLREVTASNYRSVLGLRVSDSQRRFVATNAESIAEAHFLPQAWYRAIYADDEAVGFIMLHDENLSPSPDRDDFYYLWRLMIDSAFQGRGFGRAAMDLLIAHVRTRPNAQTLLTSYLDGEGSPEGFYIALGFKPTGQIVDGEIELALPLGLAAKASVPEASQRDSSPGK